MAEVDGNSNFASRVHCTLLQRKEGYGEGNREEMGQERGDPFDWIVILPRFLCFNV